MDLLIEGVESITLACTLAVLVPAVGLTLTARCHAPVVAASYVGGLGVVAWARFGGWIPAPDSVPADLALAAVLAAATLVVVRLDLGSGAAGVAGAAFGAAISMYWRPCVGLAFADVLNEIEGSPASTLPQLLLYVAVLLLPVLVIAAVPVAIPALAGVRDHAAALVTGAVVCSVVVLVVAVGWFDDLMGELFRISSR